MSITEELEPILAAIEIVSPTAFRFCGETVQVTPVYSSSLPGIPSHPLPEVPIVRELQSTLYARCYSHRFDRASTNGTAEPKPTDPAYVARLSQSNLSRAGWEGGWIIYQLSANGQVWLMKGDRQRSAFPGEFISAGPPGMGPQVGSVVNVQVPRESTAAQAGFYFMYGETLGDVWDDQTTVRFYFNAASDLVPELVRELTSKLNRYQIPFRMKALNDPSLYGRTDAVVLYVARRHHDITAKLVGDLTPATRNALQPATPLFARPLLPGVGVAEDPNTGESFGMHRCRLVGEGIVDAWQKGDQSAEGRFRAIRSRFSQNGLVFEQPHLSFSATDLSQPANEVTFAYA